MAFGWTQLLNPRASTTEDSRPESGDADFRRIAEASGSTDDTARTIVGGTDAPTTGQGAIAPGDHVVPVPYKCSSPTKLLHWILERFITEQANASPSSTVVTRTQRSLNSAGVLTVTYQVQVTMDLADEALDQDQLNEPTMTFS